MGKSVIFNNISQYKNTINPSPTAFVYSQSLIETIKNIEKNYTYNAFSKNYAGIPNDYSKYINLYTIINNTVPKVTDTNLNLLFKITMDCLLCLFNVFDLQYQNTVLSTENERLKNELKNTIDELILTNKFKKNSFSSSGNMGLSKSFTLAPLFSYYISIYGLPEFGVGFDVDRLSKLLAVLTENGIDPYNSANNK